MLVECGFVRATLGDGQEFTFCPSLARVAGLGAPQEIVALYAALHGPDAETAAAHVLAGLCDQDDLSPLIGEPVPTPAGVRYQGGAMPPRERVIIARHLMQHGIVGRARPEQGGSGRYSDRFDASEYIAAARVHLSMSAADAEALSMTELQLLLGMKFPQQSARDVPSRAEYDELMARLMEKRRG